MSEAVPPSNARSAGAAHGAIEHPSFFIACAMLASTLAVYFPYRYRMSELYRYWDGPLYTYIARVFYSIPDAHPFVEFGLPRYYFASHFPMYPVLIRILSWFTFGNYQVAMILATISCSVAAAVLFYRLLVEWKLVTSPLWTATLFCLLPPRWVLFHSTGTTEPMFLCFVFASFLALRSGKTGWVILWVLLSSLTRISGLLLIPVFGLIYLQRKEWRNLALIPLAAVGVLGLFTLYHFEFGDFFAYFRWNAAEHKIIDLRPFQLFRLYASKVNFHSTELFLYTYLIYGIGTLALWRHKEFFFYSAIMFLYHCLIYHGDLSRYIVVVAPFALFVAYDSILSKRAVRLILPLIIYLDYVYVWGQLQFNHMGEEAFSRLLDFLGR